jgi:hypothetical protein
LHFAGGVSVVGALGGCDALAETGGGFVSAAQFGEGLRGHLVGRDVVGIVVDEGGELGEGCVGVALADVLHGEAVTGEGVGGVDCDDFSEGGYLVHELMVASGGLCDSAWWGWAI